MQNNLADHTHWYLSAYLIVSGSKAAAILIFPTFRTTHAPTGRIPSKMPQVANFDENRTFVDTMNELEFPFRLQVVYVSY